jgi:hypothetical protein
MRFVIRLGLGILLAGAALGINLIPGLQQTGITQTVVRSIIVALVIYGLWRGLSAISTTAATRRSRWLSVAIGLVAWLAVTWTLGVAGVFQHGPAANLLLPLALFLPLLIGLPLLLRSNWLGDVLDVNHPPGSLACRFIAYLAARLSLPGQAPHYPVLSPGRQARATRWSASWRCQSRALSTAAEPPVSAGTFWAFWTWPTHSCSAR